MTVRSYAGAAKRTTLSAGISNTALSFTVTAGGGSGYPTGADGPFVVLFDHDTAGEEKALCSGRTGDTFTVQAGGRGYDDTIASAHSLNASVDHVGTATDFRDANAHIFIVTRDDHTQYGLVKKTLAAGRAALAHRSMQFHYGTDSGLLGVDDGANWHDFQDKAASDAAYLSKNNMRMVESYVDPNEATASTTYVDLPTYGPALDVVAPASGVLRIAWSLGTTPGSDTALATAAVFGPGPTFPVIRAVNDADAIQSAANGTTQREFLQTGLTPGTTYRIAVMYRSQGGGSVAFFRRRLVVTPSA